LKTIHIVGGGITGCFLAYFLKDQFKVNLYETKNKLGGLCSTEYNMEGIPYQKGAHVLYTNEAWILDILNKAVEFRPVEYLVGINPLFDLRYYNFPFDKYSLDLMPWHWKEAIRLDLQKAGGGTADNLEDLVTNYYGKTIYEIFYKTYFQKMLNLDGSQVYDTGWFQKYLRPIEDKVEYFPEKAYFPIEEGYNKVFSYLTRGANVHLNSKVSRYDFPEGDTVICTGRVDYFMEKEERLPYVKFAFDIDSAMYAATKPDTIIFPNHTPFISITQFGRFFPQHKKNIIVKDFTDGEEEAIPPLGTKPLPYAPNVYFAGRQGSCQMLDMSDCIKQASSLAANIKHKERTK